ncbi:MAG TPA: hypothetical protein VHE30_16745 [Polyangiaceae bacterium]|nr:hypothetical protein [Polyangiaceae bacterium]
MTEDAFASARKERHNEWGFRRILTLPQTVERQALVQEASVRPGLAPHERSALWARAMTGAQGLEFVVRGNIELEGRVTLPGNVLIHPCFPLRVDGLPITDPIVQALLKMRRRASFIYDGWLRNTDWSTSGLRTLVDQIERSLSTFCLLARCTATWEPKYELAGPSRQSSYPLESADLANIERISSTLGSLPVPDRDAIFRSIGWLSQSLRLNEPTASFLMSLLAVESLARYIEEEASDDSLLAPLRAETRPRRQRRAEQEERATRILSEMKADPLGAVRKAYFECAVPIGRLLRRHMEGVLGPADAAVRLLFDTSEDGSDALYELRHVVAHGALNVLSASNRERIQQRTWDAERIARRYIVTVLKLALGLEQSGGSKLANFSIDPSDFQVPDERMYTGPTEMALHYTR